MKSAWLKTLIEWGGFFVALGLAMQVISWWQTRDLLDTSGDVQIPTLVLPTLASAVGAKSGATNPPALQTLAPDTTRNTLLYFFAPWCSVCRMSIGNLDAVDTEQTRVVVIALDYESIEDVQAFVDEVGVDQQVLLGNSNINKMFQIKAFPTYYVLDSRFRVISRDMGYSTATGLKLRTWQSARG